MSIKYVAYWTIPRKSTMRAHSRYRPSQHSKNQIKYREAFKVHKFTWDGDNGACGRANSRVPSRLDGGSVTTQTGKPVHQRGGVGKHRTDLRVKTIRSFKSFFRRYHNNCIIRNEAKTSPLNDYANESVVFHRLSHLLSS